MSVMPVFLEKQHRFILRRKSRTIGYIEFMRLTEKEYGTPFEWNGVYLTSFYVCKQWRGNGFAKTLMEIGLSEMDKIEVPIALYIRPFKHNDLSLDRSISKDRLREFYRKFGFRMKRTKVDKGRWMTRT